ncbi:putative C-5 sterol desaturase, partial [Operophtera brumata]
MADVRQRTKSPKENGTKQNGTKEAKAANGTVQNGTKVEDEAENGTVQNGTKAAAVTKPKYWDPLTEGVKWIENYTESLEKFMEKLPEFISTIIATFAVFTFGATLRGEWVVILVAALKQITGQTHSNQNVSVSEIFNQITSANLKMESFGSIFIGAHVVSFGIYFIMGGFLHWYFYVNRRHLAHEWKIQPDKWLSPELERHEIMVGTLSLLVTGTFSAFLACYIYNENPSTNFHKLHHKYKQPTAFSVTAIHPVEIMHVQLTMCLPLFTVPVHWLPFYAVAIYNYYHGILDHSGISFKAQWWQPWQPDAEFHDQHHDYTELCAGRTSSTLK